MNIPSLNLSTTSAHASWKSFDLSNFLKTTDFISEKLLAMSKVTNAWLAVLAATLSVARCTKSTIEWSVTYLREEGEVGW